ncbi:helix-turn-helix transcriptional regulator [Streptomyces sp. NPDC046716]|uniref:helix-turn-helix domain-containing protein n=1 Tax=Streptomyces sp. NPDC046716 TaxID=3157093 RepID=UPI0033F7BEA0
MSGPKDLVGEELRHARERADLTQQALGELLFVSGSYVGQMEAGTRRILPDMAARLDEALGTSGFFARHCTKARTSKHPEHFAAAAEAEALAVEIRQYQSLLVPGLLQTPDYARAVFIAYQPTAPDEIISNLVAVRMERAHLLDDPTKPLLWAVLDEAVLRREIGSPAVMAEALSHVAALARRRRAIVQVLPFSAGAHASLDGPLKLMYYDDAPPLSFIEASSMGQLTDDPATVTRHQLTYDLLRADALTPRQSLALIESAAEDYAHEDRALEA